MIRSTNMSETKKKESVKSTTKKDSGGSKLGQSVSKEDAQVIRALKGLYREKLLPIERKYHANKFNQPEILDAELAAKASVLLVGQYSTGKTSFIRHLIGMDYPEMHIGPEPTTDRFVAVVHGEESKVIPGNALTGVNELPFSGLSTFGSSFLNKFCAAIVPAPLLENVNIIDTPGVLSGEKQRLSRGYDFAQVSRWFAERSDLILLLFDCSKVDISDEFKFVIEELQPHESKVHCVLNKAESLDQEQLMRVYGALLWSMGRIFKGAEVTRIYVGSFRDNAEVKPEHKELFDKDRKVLMEHLHKLPKACSMRKINDMVKRIRRAVVHVCILGHLKQQMPHFFGKEAKQAQLISALKETFEAVRIRFQLAEGDFPRVEEYKAALSLQDISKFPRIDRDVLDVLQEMLLTDVPKITALVAGFSEDLSGDGDNDGNRQPELFTLKIDPHTSPTGMYIGIAMAVIAVLLLIVALLLPAESGERAALHQHLAAIGSLFKNAATSAAIGTSAAATDTAAAAAAV